MHVESFEFVVVFNESDTTYMTCVHENMTYTNVKSVEKSCGRRKTTCEFGQ